MSKVRPVTWLVCNRLGAPYMGYIRILTFDVEGAQDWVTPDINLSDPSREISCVLEAARTRPGAGIWNPPPRGSGAPGCILGTGCGSHCVICGGLLRQVYTLLLEQSLGSPFSGHPLFSYCEYLFFVCLIAFCSSHVLPPVPAPPAGAVSSDHSLQDRSHLSPPQRPLWQYSRLHFQRWRRSVSSSVNVQIYIIVQ